jgi:hypothetical protein
MGILINKIVELNTTLDKQVATIDSNIKNVTIYERDNKIIDVSFLFTYADRAMSIHEYSENSETRKRLDKIVELIKNTQAI